MSKTSKPDLSPEGVAAALARGEGNPYFGRTARLKRPEGLDQSHPQYHQVQGAWNSAIKRDAEMRKKLAAREKEQVEIALYLERMAETQEKQS